MKQIRVGRKGTKREADQRRRRILRKQVLYMKFRNTWDFIENSLLCISVEIHRFRKDP